VDNLGYVSKNTFEIRTKKKAGRRNGGWVGRRE
jgi:hypothetical protein